MPGLPAGATVRPMRLADAPAVQVYLAARSVGLIGAHQYSPEGVVNFLSDPALDLDLDTWLVSRGDRIVGTSATVRTGGRTTVEVSSNDRDVADWLLSHAIERSIQSARDAGEHELLIGLGMIHEDRQLAELAQEHGLTFATSTERMRFGHTGPIEAPPVPPGVTVHRGAFDETIRRASHQVIAGSFADQPTSIPRPYDEWVISRESRASFDWSWLTVLELSGRPVAVREWDSHFVASDNCGYIGRIGVLAKARGKGLAKYLLKDQFALDATAGLAGTMLHVDTSNPTPAVELYRSSGMVPDLTHDIWRRTLQL